jgi:uncharacterized protein (TIGR02246 family)
VFAEFLGRYAAAVNANDADAYRALCTDDAIRVPASSVVERGPDEIAASEGSDYEEAKWSVELQPVDVIALGERYIFGLAHADASLEFYADRSRGSKDAMKGFLLEEHNGHWLIKRYLWNVKPTA